MHKKFRIRFGFSCSDNRKSKIENLKWAGVVALVIAFAMCGAVATAQQPRKIPLIGFISGGSSASTLARIEGFRKGLRDLGYIEGENVAIVNPFAEGKLESPTDLAAELVRLKVDVIVTSGTEGAFAAKEATRTIPIVMTTGNDPVANGLIASLARPGGNITGLTSLGTDLSGKRLELLKETFPRRSRVGVLWNPTDQGSAQGFKEAEMAARTLGVEVQSLEVRSPNDFESAFKAAIARRAQALHVLPSSLINTHRNRIVEFATKNRLPTMFADAAHVEAGGLMSYGPNYPELFWRAAWYVDKILKGTKPADLPVEQPMKFDFVINLKTAKEIGLTIPPNVLVRAQKVIR